MVMYEDKPMNFDNWDIDMYYTEKAMEASDLTSFEWTQTLEMFVSALCLKEESVNQ